MKHLTNNNKNIEKNPNITKNNPARHHNTFNRRKWFQFSPPPQPLARRASRCLHLDGFFFDEWFWPILI